MFGEEADSARTFRNIRKSLIKSIEKKYKPKDARKTADGILKIHGLDDSRFDVVREVNRRLNESRINDASIDDNANKTDRTVESLFQEVLAAHKKLVGYDQLYGRMLQDWGKQEAKRLSGEMYDLSLGLSDTTKILSNYCYAFDFSRIVTEGRPFGQLPSAPAKNLESYVSAAVETIHQLSQHMAGAVATPTIFMDMAAVLLYKEGVTGYDLRKDRVLRKRCENRFQQFIHSVNSLSREASQSPFTNVSIMDRTKLLKLVSGYHHLLPDQCKAHPRPEGITDEAWHSDLDILVVDAILELQWIYMDLFDKGDPLNGGIPYRFPISSVTAAKEWVGERGEDGLPVQGKGKWVVADKAFQKAVCRHQIHRYNIFSSEGDKYATCCRLVNDSELMELASQANSFGAGGSVSLGGHRVCTLNMPRIAMEAADKDSFMALLRSRAEDAAKVLKSHKNLIGDVQACGLQSFIDNGWISMGRMFSIFGIIGTYEAARECAGKPGWGEDPQGEMLKELESLVKEFSKTYKISGNIEQIPGESFAVRFAKADKAVLGRSAANVVLYSNQFIPLSVPATAIERLEDDGRYNAMVSGGGIVHLTLDGEMTTPRQSEFLWDKAVEFGCEHFAFNPIISICHCGPEVHATAGKHTVCPVCGGEIRDWLTRVVGYYTHPKDWAPERRELDFPTRAHAELPEMA
jgi:ribonucleoside-triphosphate reductase